MTSKVMENNLKEVNMTVEQKRNEIIAQLEERKAVLRDEINQFYAENSQLPRQDWVVLFEKETLPRYTAKEAIDFVIKQVSNRTVNVRFDDVINYGLKFIENKTHPTPKGDIGLSFAEKTFVIKQIALVSCNLSKNW